MPALPSFDKFPSDDESYKKTILIVITYFTMILFVFLLAFALYNHIAFLLRPFKFGKLFEPLSQFYLLGEITILFRIITVIYWY